MDVVGRDAKGEVIIAARCWWCGKPVRASDQFFTCHTLNRLLCGTTGERYGFVEYIHYACRRELEASDRTQRPC